MNQPVKLQPLRIPTGWQISWNKFYEIDPPEKLTNDYYDYFDRNMFFATYFSFNLGKKIGIDLGWLSGNEDGKYVLSLVYYYQIKHKEAVKQTIKVNREKQTLIYRLEPNFTNDASNWNNTLLVTHSRIEVAEKMDEIMYDVAYKHHSKYWKIPVNQTA